jgi:predicted nucleotidyltransferase
MIFESVMAAIPRQQLIEGDYIETAEGLLFTVKGLHHPDGMIIAYLRYLPDVEGTRRRGQARYRRVYDLDETTEYLERKHPDYLCRIKSKGISLQSVPIEKIRKVYFPELKLQQILSSPRSVLEAEISRFVSTVSGESGVDSSNLGVSGSVLIDLATSSSDLDIIVYGKEQGLRAYRGISSLRNRDSYIRPYGAESVSEVVKSRWGDTGLDLDMLVPHEERKILHGLVCDRDYFVRLVPRPGEVETESRSKPLGSVTLRALIMDAQEAIYTPCRYRIETRSIGPKLNVAVTELVSFRGKFTEQASEGMEVEVRGTLEEAVYNDRAVYRVVLGGRGDYLVPIGFWDENLLLK